MFHVVYDVNAYVEQCERYGTDNVRVDLDEATFTVTVQLADVYKNALEGAQPLVTKTFEDLDTALVYYQEMIHQLYQGDVIRNI